jgi:CRISPR/Cas system-associated protein Cas10 (large subunit of type III CRISPR-Cas system)
MNFYQLDCEDSRERFAFQRRYHRGGRRYPCPTCGKPNRITEAGRRARHQCDECADKAEAGIPGY